MIPGLESRLMEGSNEEIGLVADLVSVFSSLATFHSHETSQQIQKGVSSARADNTKSLKGAVLGWIVVRGQGLSPPLARNVKTDRGFHHEQTGACLCPAGLDWSNLE